MKVLKKGALPERIMPWWVGLQMTCFHCDASIELEENDKVETTQERRPGGKATVAVECPTCANPIKGERPPIVLPA